MWVEEMRGKKIFVAIVLLLLLIPTLLLCGFFFGDITQYKRIGNTDYSLVEGMAAEGKPLAEIMHNEEGGFIGLSYEGFAKDIYWNDDYLIVKCSDRNSETIINYCIIEQKSNRRVPWRINEYKSKVDFEKAKQKLGLDESKMNYTDNHIPWSLHLKEALNELIKGKDNSQDK